MDCGYDYSQKKGNFEDLDFVSVLRFKESKKMVAQKLFHWSNYVVNYLNFRKPAGCVTLEDKKHRLLCYFFESSIQTLLSPLSNISINPGAEAFSLVFDEGYDDSVNIGETLELDVETCDLLPIIINPGN